MNTARAGSWGQNGSTWARQRAALAVSTLPKGVGQGAAPEITSQATLGPEPSACLEVLSVVPQNAMM